MGKLIVIDGVDSSGKQTQTDMLCSRLVSDKRRVRKVSFPAYDSPSSSLVKMYLAGEFGKNPGDVNAYAASAFYAMDRFATFRADWGKDYAAGTIIIADRYVTSNMIHQAGKIDDTSEREKCLDWIYDFEYVKCGLPKPDATIFLDMPVEYAVKLMEKRANKIDGGEKKDIHESDISYLKRSYESAVFVAEKYGWTRISCVEGGRIKSPEEIHDEIYRAVKEGIGK